MHTWVLLMSLLHLHDIITTEPLQREMCVFKEHFIVPEPPKPNCVTHELFELGKLKKNNNIVTCWDDQKWHWVFKLQLWHFKPQENTSIWNLTFYWIQRQNFRLFEHDGSLGMKSQPSDFFFSSRAFDCLHFSKEICTQLISQDHNSQDACKASCHFDFSISMNMPGRHFISGNVWLIRIWLFFIHATWIISQSE